MGLEPWLFALLWTGVGFFALFLMLATMGSEPLQDKRKEHDLALLEAFQQKDAATKVVIIGNSKLRYATLPEAELEAAAARAGLDAAFVRLLSNNAVFSHFDYALEPLLEQQPDIIVIQAPLLLQEPAADLSRFQFFQQYVRWRLIGGTIEGVDPHQIQHDLVCNPNVSDQMHADYRDRIERQRNYEASGENGAAAVEFIRRARERGIHVVAVTAPVTSRLQVYLEAVGDVAMLREQALPRAPDNWHYQDTVADDQFCDPMHLAPAGRAAYTAWLIEQVSRWQADRQDDSLALNIMESS